MTRWLLVVFALAVSLGAQNAPLPPNYQPSPNPPQAPEAYPGAREHKEPPAGWFCEPVNPKIDKQPEHPCACKRMAQKYEDGTCVHNEDGTEHIQADPQCSSFCWERACKCVAMGCDT